MGEFVCSERIAASYPLPAVPGGLFFFKLKQALDCKRQEG